MVLSLQSQCFNHRAISSTSNFSKARIQQFFFKELTHDLNLSLKHTQTCTETHMCSEKGYAHTEQGKEERRKKGYTGLCSLMETSILLIQFLSFLSLFIYLFLFALYIHVDCIFIFWYRFVWMCLHICVYQRTTSFLSIPRVQSTLLFLSGLQFAKQTRMAGQQSMDLPPQHWNQQPVPPCLAFLCEFCSLNSSPPVCKASTKLVPWSSFYFFQYDLQKVILHWFTLDPTAEYHCPSQ